MAYTNYYRSGKKVNIQRNYYWVIIGSNKYLASSIAPYRWTPHKGEALLFETKNEAEFINKRLNGTKLQYIKIPRDEIKED